MFKDLKRRNDLFKRWGRRLTHMFNSIPLRVEFGEDEGTVYYLHIIC